GRVDRARRPRGAERPLRELAVLAPGEERAPMLQLVDVAGRLGGEDLDRVLVADVVRALDGVVGVDLRRVVFRVPERGVDAALSGAGMAPGRVELRDHRNIRACIVRGDGRAHACAAGAHYEDVVLTNHCKRTLPNLGDSPELDPWAGRGQLRVVEP